MHKLSFSLCFSSKAIDVAPGGPPCVDFSRVNGNRKGIDGAMRKLIIEVAELMKRIENQPLQLGQPLYYLVENVVLADDVEKGKNDLSIVSKSFGVEPITLHSAFCSPCQRTRMYWTNFPSGVSFLLCDAASEFGISLSPLYTYLTLFYCFTLKTLNYSLKFSASISVKRCLEDGWELGGP